MTKSGLMLVAALLLCASRSMAEMPGTDTVTGGEPVTMGEKEESALRTQGNTLQGRHVIQLGIGLLSDYGFESGTSKGSTVKVSDHHGVLGSLSYNYWIRDDLAYGVRIGLQGSEVRTVFESVRSSVETSSAISVLAGIRYQPTVLPVSDAVRPYIGVSVGPFVGSATKSFTGTTLKTETHTETTLASRFGVGADFRLGDLFVAGISAGYFLAMDFDKPVGPEKNYSSPEFSLSLGVSLGGTPTK